MRANRKVKKNKNTKAITAIVIVVVVVVAASLCALLYNSNSNNINQIKVEKPDFPADKVSEYSITYEIPKTWSNSIGAIKRTQNQEVYAPIGSNIVNGTSNINVIVDDNTDNATLQSYEKKKSSLVSSIKNTFSGNASDFVYSSFSVNAGDVLEIDYNVVYNGKQMKQSQFYVITSTKIVTITSTDISDNTEVSPKDVGLNAAISLSVD